MRPVILFLTLVVLISPLPALAGRKPAPRPVHHPMHHPAAAEIKRLSAEIGKLQRQQQAEVAKVQARYAAQVARLNLPGLHAEITRLHKEKTLAVYKKLPTGKLEAIQAQYQPKIQAVTKKLKGAQAQTVSLTRKRKAELAKIRAAYAKQIAALDPPEGKLEVLLARAYAQAAAEGYKLLQAEQAANVKAKFQAQIAALQKKIRSRDALLPQLNKQVAAQTAAIQAAYQARIAEINLTLGGPALQKERLLAARAFKLARTTDRKQREQIVASYAPKLAAVQKVLDARSQAVAVLNQEQNAQLSALNAVYDAELAKIVPPGVLLETELYLLWADQSTAIANQIAAAKLQAYQSQFLGQVASLKGKVKAKQAQLAKLNQAMNAAVSKAEAAYAAQIAALNPLDNLLEYQLVRLQEQQWMEILWVIGPATYGSILNSYDPLITTLTVQLESKKRSLGPISRRAMADMNRIVNDYNRRIAGLQAHIARLLGA